MSSSEARSKRANDEAGTSFLFNPKHPTFQRDPYEHYRRLRERAPVHRNFMGIWVAASYEHVRSVLRDARFRSRDIPTQLQNKSEMLKRLEGASGGHAAFANLFQHSRLWLTFLEGSDHSRIRRLVAKAFQQRAVESLRPMIRDAAVGLLAPLRDRGEFDLMKEFSYVLPMGVIASTLGVPRTDIPKIAAWTEIFTRIFDPLMSLEEYMPLEQASVSAMGYFRSLIEERRHAPADDLLSALIQAGDDTETLTEDEIIAVCILLFSAGSETSGNLFGTGTLALLRNPTQLALLRRRPDLIANAVEELLRYDAPLQMTSRTALEDLELAGERIKKHEQIYLLIGSANRDPAQFEQAEELNVERAAIPHLSFSAGPHFCLGATLARVEAQEGFRAILELFPNLTLPSDEVEWSTHTVVRGLKALPVRV
jgi:pimeloyl-[acyl-carrier protein] synthase